MILKTKVAYFGIFTTVALIFSYIESLIPVPIGIPGIKLGLANLVIVVALYKMSVREAALLSVLRIVLSRFMFANMFIILYSLSGGLLSLLMMSMLKKTNKFSVIGISISGGVFHNIGQLIMASLVLESFSLTYYLPVLLISGLVTGFIIGIVSNEMLKRMKKIEL